MEEDMEGPDANNAADELQRRIVRIAQEAKLRNPNGYSLTPPRVGPSMAARKAGAQSASSALIKPKFSPFVTASGQHIIFHDDAVNVPASCLREDPQARYEEGPL